MRKYFFSWSAAGLSALFASTAMAQDVQQTGGGIRRGVPISPPCNNCAPMAPVVPLMPPNCLPGQPGYPGQPVQPGMLPNTQPGSVKPGTTQPGTTQPGTTQPGTTQPNTTQPNTTQPNNQNTQTPNTQNFSQSDFAGGSTGGSGFNTGAMMGDSSGRYTTATARSPVVIRASGLQGRQTVNGVSLLTDQSLAQIILPAEYATRLRIPYASSGTYKISESESPRPQDRFYINFNYFNSLRLGNRPLDPSLGVTATTSLTNFGLPTLANASSLSNSEIESFNNVANIARQLRTANPAAYNAYIRGVLASGDALKPKISDPALNAVVKGAIATAKSQGAPDSLTLNTGTVNISGGAFGAGGPTTLVTPPEKVISYYRETFGFEKTFWNGDASVGVRLPVIQTTGDNAFSGVGDISFILKYAFFNDPCSGNLLSAGLVVTAPTGGDLGGIEGQTESTLIQPFVGGIKNMGRWYLQGFSAITFPTNDNDVTIWSNDIGLGYRLIERDCGWIRAVNPLIELHVNSPLNKRNEIEPAFTPDIVSFTYGVQAYCGERSLFSLGLNTPVTGPKPYDYEIFAQWSYNFGNGARNANLQRVGSFR